MNANHTRTLLLKHAEKIPRLSVTVHQVLREIVNPEVTVKGIAGIVEKDVPLTGHVLQVANSAAYGRRGRVTSVAHAVALMGLDRFRTVLTTVAVIRLTSRLNTPQVFSIQKFNRHAAYTAIATDVLVQELPFGYAEGAYLAGLLHDIGKLIYVSLLPGSFEDVVSLAESSGLPEFQCERRLLGTDHAELGFQLLSLWGVAQPLAQAVLAHHTPEQQSSGCSGALPLALAVHAADEFSLTIEHKRSRHGELTQEDILECAPKVGHDYDRNAFSSSFLEELRMLEEAVLPCNN
jgi:HD-like signal output (HDOD) protein